MVMSSCMVYIKYCMFNMFLFFVQYMYKEHGIILIFLSSIWFLDWMKVWDLSFYYIYGKSICNISLNAFCASSNYHFLKVTLKFVWIQLICYSFSFHVLTWPSILCHLAIKWKSNLYNHGAGDILVYSLSIIAVYVPVFPSEYDILAQ